MKRQAGFTLIELMVAVLVFAILVAIGVPSFRTMIMNNRLTSESNDFLTSMLLARSEAIKRNVNVYLCASSNGSSCNGSNWEDGWIVFSDAAPAAAPDHVPTSPADCKAGDDCVLSVTGSISSSGLTLRGSGTNVATRVGYSPLGLPVDKDGGKLTGSGASFTLCDERGASYARAVQLSPSGRPSTVDGKSTTLSCP